jgi:hypothetical protein
VTATVRHVPDPVSPTKQAVARKESAIEDVEGVELLHDSPPFFVEDSDHLMCRPTTFVPHPDSLRTELTERFVRLTDLHHVDFPIKTLLQRPCSDR